MTRRVNQPGTTGERPNWSIPLPMPVESLVEDAVIVGMVLDLAASLGLGVVAEGVETAGQEAELRRLHCPQVQGFRYSPAVPEAEVPSLIERFSTSASPTS
jgi:EAL domain-containing protein (putative c-di-GMP-specific phosphodiesterase class I)